MYYPYCHSHIEEARRPRMSNSLLGHNRIPSSSETVFQMKRQPKKPRGDMGEIPSPDADLLNATADSGYDSEGNNNNSSSWVFGRAKNRNDARKVGISALNFSCGKEKWRPRYRHCVKSCRPFGFATSQLSCNSNCKGKTKGPTIFTVGEAVRSTRGKREEEEDRRKVK